MTSVTDAKSRSSKKGKPYPDWEEDAEHFEGKRVITYQAIACSLRTLFSKPPRSNSTLPADKKLYSAFHSIALPKISIETYFLKLVAATNCTVESCFIALEYLDRIYRNHSEVEIDLLTIHRLLLTSLVCATKFFEDRTLSNDHWAKSGGVKTRELASMEFDFLKLVDHALFVSEATYLTVFNQVLHPRLHETCKCQANKLYRHHPLMMRLSTPIPMSSAFLTETSITLALQDLTLPSKDPPPPSQSNDSCRPFEAAPYVSSPIRLSSSSSCCALT